MVPSWARACGDGANVHCTATLLASKLRSCSCRACCQCLASAPAEITGVRKVLAGDTEGFLEISHVRKAWPQIQLAAATIDADLANTQAKAADAGEEVGEARAAEEDEAIERMLGLEAGDVDHEEEQPGPVTLAAETGDLADTLRQKILDTVGACKGPQTS